MTGPVALLSWPRPWVFSIDRLGTEVLRRISPARAVLRRVDPAYDHLDEHADDFLAQLGEVVGSSGVSTASCN